MTSIFKYVKMNEYFMDYNEIIKQYVNVQLFIKVFYIMTIQIQ